MQINAFLFFMSAQIALCAPAVYCLRGKVSLILASLAYLTHRSSVSQLVSQSVSQLAALLDPGQSRRQQEGDAVLLAPQAKSVLMIVLRLCEVNIF